MWTYQAVGKSIEAVCRRKKIDKHMQQIKTKSDALAFLGSHLDRKDLTNIVLVGLDITISPLSTMFIVVTLQYHSMSSIRSF